MTNDKTIALITGANRGIGLDTAKQLGKQGIHIVLGVRDRAAGDAAVRELAAEDVRAEVIAYDAGDPTSATTVHDELARRFGKLDILVNNAGTLEEVLVGVNSAPTIAQAVLRKTFDINFFAVVALTQTLLPLLRKSTAGRIVNVASVLGSLTVHSLPDSPLASVKPFGYDASKAALNAFTVHLADALKDTPIKVNSVHPGWVKTPLGGDMAPSEVEGSGKTSARLATIGADGPTGKFFDGDTELPW